MRASRFYIDQDLSLKREAQERTIVVTGPRAHYMRNVLRLKVGDLLQVFDGNGGEYDAKIESVERHNVSLGLLTFRNINRQSSLEIHLGLALIKRDAMDNAIQKATELGVTSIQALTCERVSVSQKDQAKQCLHWQEISINACEQCGLNIPPEIYPITNLSNWIQQTSDIKLVASPASNRSLRDLNASPKKIMLAIGPEGGFTEIEVKSMLQSDFIDLHIGSRILRADTAVTSLIALLQSSWGDLT